MSKEVKHELTKSRVKCLGYTAIYECDCNHTFTANGNDMEQAKDKAMRIYNAHRVIEGLEPSKVTVI